jgi:hypothetical protein
MKHFPRARLPVPQHQQKIPLPGRPEIDIPSGNRQSLKVHSKNLTALTALALFCSGVVLAPAQSRIKTVPGVRVQQTTPPTPPTQRTDTDRNADTPKDVKFGKVYQYVNDPAFEQPSLNLAQEFERRYFNFGAVTSEQYRQKTGHYFTFFWKPIKPLGPGRVVWEYLQENDKNKVHIWELPFARASGWQHTRFAVTGRDYAPHGKNPAASADGGGRVIAWRLRIYEADKLAGETTSFVW